MCQCYTSLALQSLSLVADIQILQTLIVLDNSNLNCISNYQVSYFYLQIRNVFKLTLSSFLYYKQLSAKIINLRCDLLVKTVVSKVNMWRQCVSGEDQ